MNSTRGSNEIRAGSTYRCLNDYHHLSLVTFRVTNKLNLFREFWVAKPSKAFVLESSSFKVTVQFSCSVLSDSLWPHGLQHARPPCPSLAPGVYSNSCPLSQWCHPITSSSVTLCSSCLQSFPASGSFQMSQLFISGGQSIGVSASASVLPMNIQDWSPLEWTGWISLQSKDSQESSPAPQFKSNTLLSGNKLLMRKGFLF